MEATTQSARRTIVESRGGSAMARRTRREIWVVIRRGGSRIIGMSVGGSFGAMNKEKTGSVGETRKRMIGGGQRLKKKRQEQANSFWQRR